MNRTHFLRLVGTAVLASFVGTSAAADKGTPAEAEKLVGQVVADIKANGEAKTLAAVNDGKSYKDRDMYIFVYDMTGKCVAHGMNAKLVGKNLMGMKDPDGKPLIKMMVDLASAKGRGWTDEVKFMHPLTGKIQTRVNYIERVGDVIVGSGVFKD
ncbi:MAG: cache domain-containing protein [Lautropia sp.]